MLASLREWVLVAVMWPLLAVVSFLSAAVDDSFDDEGAIS